MHIIFLTRSVYHERIYQSNGRSAQIGQNFARNPACLDIIWVIYRLVKSINANDMIFLIVAVLLIVIGLPWLWLVDIITLIITDNVIWFSSK